MTNSMVWKDEKLSPIREKVYEYIIARAVLQGEADLAETLAKIHIENSKRAYMETMEKQT